MAIVTDLTSHLRSLANPPTNYYNLSTYDPFYQLLKYYDVDYSWPSESFLFRNKWTQFVLRVPESYFALRRDSEIPSAIYETVLGTDKTMMRVGKNYLFNKIEQVDIYGLRHYRVPNIKDYVPTIGGGRNQKLPYNYYPSVTTILSLDPEKSESLDLWRKKVGAEQANKISSMATARGRALHFVVEKYLKREDLGILMPTTKALFNKIKPALHLISDCFQIEQTLYSDEVQLAGTPDCIGVYDGLPSVIDFKTSTREKRLQDIDHYFAQCAAYGKMWAEHSGFELHQYVVIIAVEDGTSQVFVKRDVEIQRYLNLVEKCSIIYERKYKGHCNDEALFNSKNDPPWAHNLWDQSVPGKFIEG